MNDIGTVAENIVIYDYNDSRRSTTAVEVVRQLISLGYTVYIFAGQQKDVYIDLVHPFYLRSHMPIDSKDLADILHAKKEHKRIAVVLHGVITPGGPVMNRLLSDQDISVISISRVPAVKGDHRYSTLWTEGKKWWKRSPAKGFEIIDMKAPKTPTEPEVSKGWFNWVWG